MIDHARPITFALYITKSILDRLRRASWSGR